MIEPRLAALRKAQEFSQGQLATRSGVRQGTISKIERGQRPNPGIETVRKLATALNVDPAELLKAA